MKRGSLIADKLGWKNFIPFGVYIVLYIIGYSR